MPARSRTRLRNLLEFLPAWLLLKAFGLLPRRAAIFMGKLIARAVYYIHGRLRHTAHRNLTMAMPEMTADERVRVIKGVFRNMGRLLGEFSQFPKLTREKIGEIVVYDGFENYQSAAGRGKGVLLLTGHVGSWELCAFAQGLYGHPLSFLVRLLDNPLINRMANDYRELSGNRTINKMMAVKAVLETLKHGEDVGLLIDVNVLEDQGIFCDFFGILACSTTGLAVFALRADAPVVPGFLIWDERLKKHRLRFDPEIPLVRTGDFKEEVRINTERFTRVIEEYARCYPDQWLWIHKRWKTRPQGEPDLYGPDEPARPSRSHAKVEAEA